MRKVASGFFVFFLPPREKAVVTPLAAAPISTCLRDSTRFPHDAGNAHSRQLFEPMSNQQTFDFGVALDALRVGGKCARTGWNGKGMWLECQFPDENSKMTLPYLYLNYPAGEVYPDGARVPWLASQTDLLSEDWIRLP